MLAYMAFPARHRIKLHSTNPLARLNKEVNAASTYSGYSPNEKSILRLIGAVLFEQDSDGQSQHRSVMIEAISQIDTV